MSGAWRKLRTRTEGLVSQYRVHDLPVTVLNSRPDIDEREVMIRLSEALTLIAEYAPRRLSRLRRDISGIIVRRFPCRGAYLPETRECLVELTFTVNPRHGLAEIAASIVHEGTHARIARMCGQLPEEQRPQEERMCRKAELEFGLRLPDGAIVVERARSALQLADRDVAPRVDWAEGARRVAAEDRRSNH
jgi:hypothetical protein